MFTFHFGELLHKSIPDEFWSGFIDLSLGYEILDSEVWAYRVDVAYLFDPKNGSFRGDLGG